MSVDIGDVTTVLLDNQVLPYVVEPVLQGVGGPDLAMTQPNTPEGGAILQSSDSFGFNDDPFPAFTYEPDMPSDDPGSGYIEVYEPVIYVPDGFVEEDLYAVEFILNESTGELTINFLFSTDPLDHQSSEYASLTSEEISTGLPKPGLGVEDISPEQAGQVNGSKCTVTITKTTTQHSGSSSWSIKVGVGTYTSSSGSSSTTTTTTRTYEGTLINGRCMVRDGR